MFANIGEIARHNRCNRLDATCEQTLLERVQILNASGLRILGKIFAEYGIGLFSSLQEGQITTDYLTEMNNRREATRFIEEAVRKTNEELPLWLIMVEIAMDTKEMAKQDINEETLIVKAAKIISDVAYLHDVFASRWSDNEFIMVAQGMDIVRVSDFEEGIIWRLKWELFEKGEWKSASVGTSRIRCEDKESSVTELVNSLKLKIEEK